MPKLHKSLSTFSGTALMMNIVVGAGLLSLPGLSVAAVGDHALWSWVVCAVLALPLLATFIIMGKRYPNAGGVAHFAAQAFGPYAYATTSMMFLGAVTLGLPAVALSGGYYAVELFSGHPAAYAAGLIFFATIAHLFRAEIVSKISTAVASGIVLVLLGFIAVGLNAVPWENTLPIAGIQEIDFILTLSPFMMIFFAFTGWEVAAGSAEEFRNPKRDFPRAMILSYVAVCVLYFATVFIVQTSGVGDNPASAFAAIARKAVGAWGGVLVALLACLMILANLIGAIWAVSRLVYALSREGYLPIKLKISSTGTPLSSVLIVGGGLSFMLIFQAIGWINISFMMGLAGQNFLLMFGIAAAAMFTLAQQASDRLIAGAAFVLVIVLVILEGQLLLYPAALIVLGIGIAKIRSQQQ